MALTLEPVNYNYLKDLAMPPLMEVRLRYLDMLEFWDLFGLCPYVITLKSRLRFFEEQGVRMITVYKRRDPYELHRYSYTLKQSIVLKTFLPDDFEWNRDGRPKIFLATPDIVLYFRTLAAMRGEVNFIPGPRPRLRPPRRIDPSSSSSSASSIRRASINLQSELSMQHYHTDNFPSEPLKRNEKQRPYSLAFLLMYRSLGHTATPLATRSIRNGVNTGISLRFLETIAGRINGELERRSDDADFRNKLQDMFEAANVLLKSWHRMNSCCVLLNCFINASTELLRTIASMDFRRNVAGV